MRWNFDESASREGTNCVKYDLRKEVFGRSDVIPMWVADMDFLSPPFISDAVLSRAAHKVYGYSFRPEGYYKSIIDWNIRRHAWTIDKESIIFCPGVVPALNFCTLTFTEPDDCIIIQPPVYFPFFPAVDSHGRTLIMNQLIESDGLWKMDFDDIREKMKQHPAMIIISNPHNPAGRAWRKEELSELVSICYDNNVVILSDEIHCDLVLPRYKHIPVATISNKAEEITVTCIAPSKTFNLAGLSTASVIIPNPELRTKFSSFTEKLHVSGGNLFGTVASEAAYRYGDEWLDELLLYLEGNSNLVIEYCRDAIPGIIPVRPEATYLMWLDCRGLGMSGKDLMDFFVNRAGVGMNEGSTFGPGGEGFMRMNIGCPRSTVLKALGQIRSAVNLLTQ